MHLVKSVCLLSTLEYEHEFVLNIYDEKRESRPSARPSSLAATAGAPPREPLGRLLFSAAKIGPWPVRDN